MPKDFGSIWLFAKRMRNLEIGKMDSCLATLVEEERFSKRGYGEKLIIAGFVERLCRT